MIDTTPAPPRKAALVFIFITVALDMLALGMIVPVLPKLIERLMGGDTARAVQVVGLFGTSWAAMQFLASPVQGALSDHFGRRPVILLSNLGLGLDYILMALAPSVGWLFLGRIISGATSASVATASAYIADVTAPERRAAAFGMINAAFGLGFIVGPAVGGMLGAVGVRLPFWVAAALSLLNAGYGVLVLPESLPRDRRSGFHWRAAHPLASLTLVRSRAALARLAVVSFLGNIAHEALPTVFALYASFRYGWTERAIGLAVATVGVCTALVGGVLVRPAIERLGERRVLLTGIAAGAAGFALYGLARTGTAFWLAIPVNMLWGLNWPAMQSVMTRLVGASEQGQLQGAISSLRGIAFMIGPVLFAAVFAYSIDPRRLFPGVAFLVAALLLGVSLVPAWRGTRNLEV